MDNIGSVAAARVSQAMQAVGTRISQIEERTGLTFSSYMLRQKTLSSVSDQLETGEVAETRLSGETVTDLTENYTPGSVNVTGNAFEDLPSSDYDSLLSEAASRYGLNPALLKAVCYAESGFREGAVSAAGAMGLMQLMPYTADALGVENPYDPEQNVDGGARLLSSLLDKYGGNALMAVAAYNCGSGGLSSRGITDLSAGTQRELLPSETLSYLENIESYLASVGALNVLDSPYNA